MKTQPKHLDTHPWLASDSQATPFALTKWQTCCTRQHWYIPHSLFFLCSPLSQACKCKLGVGRHISRFPLEPPTFMWMWHTHAAQVCPSTSLYLIPYPLHSLHQQALVTQFRMKNIQSCTEFQNSVYCSVIRE